MICRIRRDGSCTENGMRNTGRAPGEINFHLYTRYGKWGCARMPSVIFVQMGMYGQTPILSGTGSRIIRNAGKGML